MSPSQQQQSVDQASQDTVMTREKTSTASEFNKVTEKWIDICAKSLNLDKLKQHLGPIVADQYIDDVEEAFYQGQDFMRKQMKEAIDQKLKETDLIEKMDKMDILIAEAKQRPRLTEPRAVPTPKQVEKGVFVEEKRKESESLLEELNQLREENKLLMEKLGNKKIELVTKRTDISRDIEKFKRATDIINTIDTDGLVDTMNRLDLLRR